MLLPLFAGADDFSVLNDAASRVGASSLGTLGIDQRRILLMSCTETATTLKSASQRTGIQSLLL